MTFLFDSSSVTSSPLIPLFPLSFLIFLFLFPLLISEKHQEKVLAILQQKIPPAEQSPAEKPKSISFHGLPEPIMQVFIKTLTGKTVTVEVHPEYTVAHVKHLVNSKMGSDEMAMTLIFAGRTLEDKMTIGSYNIRKESTIHQLYKMDGKSASRKLAIKALPTGIRLFYTPKTVHVDSNESIQFLKLKIWQATGEDDLLFSFDWENRI